MARQKSQQAKRKHNATWQKNLLQFLSNVTGLEVQD
jgi:hypothetical protein